MPEVPEVGVEEVLDAPVGGGQVAGEEEVLLAEVLEHVAGQLDEGRALAAVDGQAHAGELDIDIGDEALVLRGALAVEAQAEVALDGHVASLVGSC